MEQVEAELCFVTCSQGAFFFGLFFDIEDGGDMIFRNIG
jgi:hypothetical protein